MIKEFDDLEDKRAKRVRITAKGQREIEVIEPKMKKVFKAMTAEMSLNERLHVLSFLRKINTYHCSHTKEFEVISRGQ
ncbi:MAG: hypothetical protein KAR19_02275 [Bacteroidales bacterium]|nr:hypothetical protein [Bacteroidales bacterium]